MPALYKCPECKKYPDADTDICSFGCLTGEKYRHRNDWLVIVLACIALVGLAFGIWYHYA